MLNLRWLLWSVVVCSLAAELTHLWGLFQNHAIWWVYGLFFPLVTIVQGTGAAFLLFWPRLWLIWLVLVGNLCFLLLFLCTHQAGIWQWFRLPAWPCGRLDQAGALLEVALVLLLVLLGRTIKQRAALFCSRRVV